MSNQEGVASIMPPFFNGTNLLFWNFIRISYLQSLEVYVWEIVEGGYQYPSSIPTDEADKKKYETNAQVVKDLLGSLEKSEFVKVMLLNTAKAIWYKIIQSQEGDTKVKSSKLQTFRIQYETLRMHSDEIIASLFLRVDEITNSMKNLGGEVKYSMLVEKILISLTPKFDSKVSSIEEIEDLKKLIVEQLHGILTAYEMRKGSPSDIRETTFKDTSKGNKKEELKESSYVSDEEEENFVKKLQVGIGRLRGKLPFKFFSCGRVGH